MPYKNKCTRTLLEEVARLRYGEAMKTGVTPTWEAIAAAVGVTDRSLRDARLKPLWAEILREFGSPLDDENLASARVRLGQLIHASDERVALSACKCCLELMLARRIDLVHHGAMIQVSHFDLSGITPAELRKLAATVAEVEGISPGRRALPMALDDIGTPREDGPYADREDVDDE